MKAAKTLAVALVLALLAGPGPATAWSGAGHRIIAILAAGLLNPLAQAEVADLLRDEPEPTLGGIASWADEVRRDDAYKHTAPWHYINIKAGNIKAGNIRDSRCHYAAARDCPNGDCVVAAINRQLAILGDRDQPRAQRIDALKFVVHFIGDVHQPLHASGRDDRGGNDYQINYRDGSRDGQGTSLHGVWDYWVLASREKNPEKYAATLAGHGLDGNPNDLLPGHSTAGWAEESCRIVEQPGFYPTRHVIAGSYVDSWRPLAEQRVRDAAVRLAVALNSALGDVGTTH